MTGCFKTLIVAMNKSFYFNLLADLPCYTHSLCRDLIRLLVNYKIRNKQMVLAASSPPATAIFEHDFAGKTIWYRMLVQRLIGQRSSSA